MWSLLPYHDPSWGKGATLCCVEVVPGADGDVRLAGNGTATSAGEVRVTGGSTGVVRVTGGTSIGTARTSGTAAGTGVSTAPLGVGVPLSLW